METCRICHFDSTLDDIAVQSATGRAICLGCYGRMTGTAKRLPRWLRRQVEACLGDAMAHSS